MKNDAQNLLYKLDSVQRKAEAQKNQSHDNKEDASKAEKEEKAEKDSQQ